MPVYEFYCPECHTLYSFFSRRVDTTTRPACPRCGGGALERQASLFAISKGRGDTDDSADLPPGLDEDKMMQALASMSGEMESLDEDDPKQAARVMRRLFDVSGMKMGDAMAEAMRRMEAGEDPDAVEAELGDALEQEDPFSGAGGGSGLSSLRALRRGLLPPRRDETWYPLKPAGEEAAD